MFVNIPIRHSGSGMWYIHLNIAHAVVWLQLQLQQHDEVLMFASSEDPSLSATLKEEAEYIDSCLRRPLRQVDELKRHALDQVMHEETVSVGGAPLTLTFVRQ